MDSRNVKIGTGAALAGLGGLAAAAVTLQAPENTATPATAAAKTVVETQTVVVRTVEHRVKRLKTKHRRRAARAATPAPAPQPAPAAPVVQATPVRVAAPPATATTPAPIRTRTSGSSGRGGDDGAEHESERHGSDDGAERADD
jgi:hypothetical protein